MERVTVEGVDLDQLIADLDDMERHLRRKIRKMDGLVEEAVELSRDGFAVGTAAWGERHHGSNWASHSPGAWLAFLADRASAPPPRHGRPAAQP